MRRTYESVGYKALSLLLAVALASFVPGMALANEADLTEESDIQAPAPAVADMDDVAVVGEPDASDADTEEAVDQQVPALNDSEDIAAEETEDVVVDDEVVVVEPVVEPVDVVENVAGVEDEESNAIVAVSDDSLIAPQTNYDDQISAQATYPVINERDNNDDYYYGSPHVVPVNTHIRGRISSNSDNDWFRFTLSSPAKISIKFQHPRLLTGYGQWHIDVYEGTDPSSWNNTKLYSRDITGLETLVSIPALGLGAGSYLIQIKPYTYSYWSGKTYDLFIGSTRTSGWETEYNDTENYADSISTGKRVYGTICDNGDEDWYRFTISNPSKVTLNFKHARRNTNYDQWRLRIRNLDNRVIVDRYITGLQTNVTTIPLGLPVGSYLIQITPASYNYWSSTPYNFAVNATKTNVWEKELNDYSDTATSMPLKTRMYGTIRNANDIDCYRFSISRSGRYTLNFRHPKRNTSAGQWYVSVYELNGRRVTRMEVSGLQTSRSMALDLPVGAYYVQVESYSNRLWSSATYNFAIS